MTEVKVEAGGGATPVSRVFPKQFDNTYRGHWLGLVIFVVVVAMKGLQGVESVLNARNTAVNADGIALSTFSSSGADTVVSMFAMLGLYLLVIPAQSVLVLLRYRSMIPFMYFWLLLLQIAARALHMLHPAFADGERAPHPIGFYVNIGIMAVTAVGFVLSLVQARSPAKSIAGGV